jgi:5'-nucleotidase
LSAAFHDEPTIEAMNDMGLDVSAVGNHEFDEGWQELVRMQDGGCLPDGDGANNQNSCPDPASPFPGADFQYLSANVFHTDTGKTVFPGTFVKTFDGVKVGFIGMTLHDTPTIVTASGVAGLTFTDEVATANKAAIQLQKEGVKSIIVLLHEGGFPSDPTAYNSCPGISGPIVAISAGLSHAIDAVISGHTHTAYNCALPDPEGVPRTVTSASSFGRLVTDLEFSINGRTGEILRPRTISNNLIVTRDVTPDPTISDLVTKYQALVSDIANKVIGQLSGTTTVTRTQDASGESPLGNLIADAQRNDATLVTDNKPVEIAFMNPGGIRADLVADASGNVTFGAAFTVQPFNNYDVSMDLTGQAILDLLEQQWSGNNAGGAAKVLQVSGVSYTWSASAPAGSRVVPGSVSVNGQPLDPARAYRVAANSFLSDGGDNFAAFKTGTNKYFGGLDIDALAAYLTANSPYTPVATDRINVVP